MGTAFFAWELGGGLGHVMRILPLAKHLAKRGHKVYVAAKDVAAAYQVLGESVVVLPAPTRVRNVSPSYNAAVNFAHVLHNIGFGDPDYLRASTAVWCELFRMTKPDLIVLDHSPHALLASRGWPARRVVIGSGFCVPPDVHPWPSLRPWQRADEPKLEADEDRLCHSVNAVLQSRGQPPLDRMGQLYGDVDESILTTFAQLDHYPGRKPCRYWGPVEDHETQGMSPQWPRGSGQRVYAYLKNFSALPNLLGHLNKLGLPTLVFCDGVEQRTKAKHASSTLCFATQRLDVQQAAVKCDIGITNATLSTTTKLLMAGKPVLMVPLQLEQAGTAYLVEKHGAGFQASCSRPDDAIRILDAMLADERCAKGAGKLATSLAAVDAAKAQKEMLEHIEGHILGDKHDG